MQLILDGDTDIDIKRNMSTIEGESFSEKFLTNKIIEHLADDISNGNKENIQKKDNIIPEQAEEGVIETDKDTSSKNNVTEANGQDLVDDKEPKVQSEVEGVRNAVVNLENAENVGDRKDGEKINENIDNAGDNIENVEHLENEVEDVEKVAKVVKDLEKVVKVVEDEKDKNENVHKVEISNDNLEPAITQVSDNKSAVSSVDIEQVTNNEISDNLYQEESQNKEQDTLIKTDNVADCVKEIDNEHERDIIIIENNSSATESSNEKVVEEEKSSFDTESKIEINSKNEDLKIKSEQSEVSKDLKNKETVMDCSDEILIESDTNTELSKTAAIEIDDEDVKIEEKVEPISEFHNVKNMDNKPQPQETDVTKVSQENETSQNGLEAPKTLPRFCKLSNNLDIFSDEEEDPPEEEPTKTETPPAVSPAEKQCISIDDDDDIMLIDEESNAKDNKKEVSTSQDDSNSNNSEKTIETPVTSQEDTKEKIEDTEPMEEVSSVETDTFTSVPSKSISEEDETSKVLIDKPQEPDKIRKPLLASNFVKTCKKNLVDMTRDDLEEFCILKIVESIVNKSNLGDIKAQLKTLTQKMEDYKNKAEVLAKQNRELEIVLQSVQEEVKSGSDLPITPLKITRSVGMQVLMTNKATMRKKTTGGGNLTPSSSGSTTNNKQTKNQPHPNTRNQKIQNMQIPVPRLVPANSPVAKANQVSQVTNVSTGKHVASLPNGVKNSPPALKTAEKRARVPSATVDLTDDEPPMKLSSRGAVSQGLRVLPPSNLIATQRPAFPQSMNSPRKVYIPISGPPGQTVRPGQTIMLRAVGTGPTPRPRCMSPHVNKVSPNTPAMRLGRMQSLRHPGPLPEALKQCQPPNWKALPPAPDIKLAKVENGIVISWKIEGFVAENYEDIASFQLYAYQESTLPPSTNLWKKIGDVKALPLPMACTLTQFMPGYKYYFAVRAVDVKTRLGPFSLPASILLLNST